MNSKIISPNIMKRRHILIIISVFVLFFSIGLEKSEAQDLIFSQYYNAPIHINPAFAGTVAYPHFTTNYRMQWPSLNSVYKTYAVTYDQYFKKMNSGLGFIAISDDQGDGTLKTTKLAGIYSYKIRFNQDWQIKFGIEAGINQSRLNWDKLIFLDQIDAVSGPFDTAGIPYPSKEVRPESLSNSFLDVSMGLLLYNPLYYVGISLDHVNGPYAGFTQSETDASSESLPVLLTLHGGLQIVLEEDNKGKPTTFISPNIVYARQSSFNQVNLGAYIQVREIFGGVWIRHTLKNIDSYIFSFGLNLNNIKIGYSFDLTSSKLGLSTGGSHEVGISIGLANLEKKESKYNDCLSLFR